MNKIKIYQLDKNNEETRKVMFLLYSFIGSVKENNYNLVYKMEISEPINDENEKLKLLESLFIKFNMDRPIDFEGHSLNISDVIELNGKYFYVDSIGFTDITEEWRNSIIEELEDMLYNKYLPDRDVLMEAKFEAYSNYRDNEDMTKEKAIEIAFNEVSEWYRRMWQSKCKMK